MSLQDWLSLLACAGHLALATAALLRASRSPLAWLLAALCVDFFAFNAAEVAGNLSNAPGWSHLDNAASTLAPALVLHFSLAFIGRRRPLRVALVAAYVYFGGLCLTCLLAFLSASAAAIVASAALPLLLGVGLVPVVGGAFALLTLHLTRSSDPLERARSGLMIGAFLVGTIGSLTDLAANLGLGVPRLANVGTLLSTLCLATVALRLGLFERRVSATLALNALLVGLLQILGCLAVFRWFSESTAMLVLGTATVTLALAPTVRGIVLTHATQRARLAYHATLGRMAEQMAHDLKNPLAALRGAAEFLAEEQASGRSLDGHGELLTLILDQADRVRAVIERYQHMGSVEATLAPLDLNPLVEQIVAAQQAAAPARVTLRRELAAMVPTVPGDRDLLASAIENLVRNAFEALGGAGEVVVRTHTNEAGRGRVVEVSVEDDGPGMDARTRERACDDFFTTKAEGSGLGLSFVRRVVEAHGGEVRIESRDGKGTVVRLRLPAA